MANAINMTLGSITLENFDPAWLWALVVIGSLAIVVLTYVRMYQRGGRRLAWWLMTLRLLGVTALLIAIVKPAVTRQKRVVHKPRLGVIIDDSQSMGEPHGTQTRYEAALKRLAPLRADTRFATTMFDIGGRTIKALPADANGEQTDLTRALESAASTLRGQGAVGIVLVSDGHDTTGRGSSLLSMQDYALPVYAVGFSGHVQTGERFDLAMRSVDAPQRVLVHNTVKIEALISKNGGPAVTTPVTIERGSTVLQSQKVDLPDGAATRRVTIEYTPDQPGDFVLTARIASPPHEGPATNNTQQFRLRVESEPIHVMLIEGTLRNELTFLKGHLHDDPDVDLVSLVRSARAGGGGPLFGGDLFSDDRMKKIDVVLLGDFEPGMLDKAAYTSLRKWVEGGGGIMVLGGYRNLGPQGLATTALGDTLPMKPNESSRVQLDQPFELTPTAAGLAHPAMSMTGDKTADANLWKQLPPLLGCVAVGPVKPGATVLAVDPMGDAGGGASGLPVLIEQSFGKGHVVVMAADSTWRWSRLTRLAGEPDTMYVRFWSQWVRYLAGRGIDQQPTPLTIATDSPSYDRGRRVQITVRRNPAAAIPGQNLAASKLTVEVVDPDHHATALSPTRSAGDPNTWTASYYPTRGGRFQINAQLTGEPSAESPKTPTDKTSGASQSVEFLVRGSKLELDDASPNPTTLAEISRLTGGVYTDIDDAGGLTRVLDQISSQPRVTYTVQTARLWHSPLLLAAFVVLTSAEWFIRRRNQMV